ncbi:MAG: helix-turn-helix domain-containing protein [Ruminococcus sp.]|nr:helix-turn-helix domain-containing protein [Ruminococcus sp.]
MNTSDMELLTLKECIRVIHGISHHTIRKLVIQGKLPAEKADGKPNGKILVRKSDLLAYFEIDE